MPSLSLLTINCFGVPTPGIGARLRTLARELNRRAFDAVCVQEVQAHPLRRLLVEACTSYPYHAYEPFVHAPKGGLLTLSRLPVEAAAFTLYRERGLWYTPAMADWLLHKGVLVTRMMLDDLCVIVLNTHLQANYSGDWRPANPYARQEREQLRELAQLVNAQPFDTLVIVAGDFNVPRGSWLYREFINATGLIDPLADDQRPTLRLPRGLPQHFAAPIDFVLVRPPTLPGIDIAGRLCFAERMPLPGGKLAYLSDHLAVELRLAWENGSDLGR